MLKVEYSSKIICSIQKKNLKIFLRHLFILKFFVDPTLQVQIFELTPKRPLSPRETK